MGIVQQAKELYARKWFQDLLLLYAIVSGSFIKKRKKMPTRPRSSMHTPACVVYARLCCRFSMLQRR
jgi:hypothetical protein